MTDRENVVIGLFERREAADRAMENLCSLSLLRSDLRETTVVAGRYSLASDYPGAARMLLRTIAVGAVAGACAGVIYIGFAAGAYATWGLPALLVGLYGGAIWGALVGSWFGLSPEGTAADSNHLCEILHRGQAVLVVARTRQQVAPIRRAMRRAGVVCFLAQTTPLPEEGEGLIRAA
jgi:hypothetical protein